MPRFSQTAQSLPANAGIAIGPILFIIAILAILAAAIAAGSGSFTSGTSSEGNRTKASAMIQIGENLKVGMDRIVMEEGIDPTTVDTNYQNVTLTNGLFSPTGGGVTPPSVTMSNDPTSDKWYYVTGPVNGFGTSASEVFAVLHVSPGVCSEINNRAVGTAATPAGADLGNFAAETSTAAETVNSWPSSSPNLAGVGTGCVNNSNGGSNGTYYYQILAIQ